MSSEFKNIPAKDNLDSQSAYLAHLRGDDTQALTQLEGKNDSQSIRRRIEVHLDAERYEAAAAIVRDRPLDAVWCDKAAFALARNGELEAARRILNWANTEADRTTWRRCLLRYADARYHKALERIGLGEPILPGDLSPEESAAMRDILATLRPNLLAIESVGRVENELESLSVQLALHASALLGDHSLSAKLVALLNTRTPVPLTLPRLALEHMVVAQDDLSSRLREGHPDSFEARILASLLDADQQQLPTAAFETAKALVPLAASVEDRITLCKVLNEVAQRLGASALSEVDTIASTIIPADHRFRRQLYADRMVRRGTPEDARAALDAIRDEKDAYWLQLYANYLLQIGDGRSAADYFARASKLYPNPYLLRVAAAVARDFNRLPLAQNALERFLAREPNAVPEHIELAMVYVRQNLFAKAADQFDLLRKLKPNDEEHQFNLALSLWRAGRLQDSLNEFNSASTGSQPALRTLIARAELLKSMGRAAEGFNSLIAAREKHWDNYQFVGAVLNLAYAAQREDIGNEALLQLTRLQQAGKAPPEILQKKTIDDLKNEILKHRERSDLACRFVLQNRAPWLFADKVFRYPSYWSWTVRTQELDWISDDPITRSQRTLYATNGFAVRKGEALEGTLEPIEAANAGDAVVVDISALITLHGLELLDKTLDYFGHLYIPAEYMSFAVDEIEHLRPHQPSRPAAMEAIRTAIDAGALRVANNADMPGHRPFPFVSEHTLEEDVAEHYYRLVDVLNVIYVGGRVSESERQSWSSVAHMPSGVDSLHPTLGVGGDVLVQLSTLMTIAQIGGLRYTLDTFKVYISENDRNEILRDLNGYTLQQSILAKHENLWNRVRQDARFIQKPVEVPTERKEERDNLEVSFASALLAHTESKPLFADDRALQCIVLNARSGAPGVAFGTDSLLASLHTSNRLSTADYYRSVLQLMEWRYRFLIPPPEMLKAFALEYTGNPPGRKLLLVARYLHESMQDPGLLAGFEPTTPPTSIASRLFLSLTGAVAEFLVDLWLDESVMEPVAKTITEWATREMLPSAPKNMGIQGDLITSLRPRLIMSRALIRGCTATNVARANAGVRAIALSLGMDEAEYWAAITEVINGV